MYRFYIVRQNHTRCGKTGVNIFFFLYAAFEDIIRVFCYYYQEYNIIMYVSDEL